MHLAAIMILLVTPLSVPGGVSGDAGAWVGFAYVAAVSTFLGFFAWYRGLALGGVARIGQIQLAQPVLTLLWSALFLAEQVTLAMLVAALAVLACVVATQRTRAASAHDERGRRRALDRHGDFVQRAALPRRAQ